ncbi:hypothetical protein NQ315_011088 [Exocentrus adspersus]|uniref:RNase H type-1 domain-containing protein n=1 Tax=Exocentrus adspersus TaxID=1586481 RepID=A0AAV8VX21_9CUCU|nr:hypothetical protein NQ315_011088 [Exocentrus adspersus]
MSVSSRTILVQQCGDALESLARQKEVELGWVPGHMGISGNESWLISWEGRLRQKVLGTGDWGAARGRGERQ